MIHLHKNFFWKLSLIWFFGCLVILVYALWYDDSSPQPYQTRIVGFISNLPEVGVSWQSFKVDGVKIRAAGYAKYQQGDLVAVEGMLDKNAINFAKVELLSPDQSMAFFEILASFGDHLSAVIKSYLHEPYSALVAGIAFGDSSLTQKLKQNLIATGTIHVVVVSGQNIAMVAGFFSSFASYLGRRLSLVLAVAVSGLYALLVGFEPPAIRAWLMATMAVFGQLMGRQNSGVWSLVICGLAMIALDRSLTLDLSFQLSFLSTFGVLVIAPWLVQRMTRLPVLIKQDAAISLAAQIMVVPLLLYHFGRLSLIAPLANIAVMWLIVPILTLGVMVALIGSMINWLGAVFAFIVYPPAWLFVTIIDWMAKLPLVQITDLHINIIIVILYYFVIFSMLLWKWLDKNFTFGC